MGVLYKTSEPRFTGFKDFQDNTFIPNKRYTMRNKLSNVRAYCVRPLLAATLGLALVFTLSCSSGDDSGGGDSGSSPSVTKGTFTDSRDGKSYKTVNIGTQTWMAENLNYNASDSKCYNCATYGRLYDWATAKTACPSGWLLPNQDEWNTLSSYVESDKGCTNCAFKHLKATSGWNSNFNGTDSYGFSALPGGIGLSDGRFSDAGDFGYWWSATEYYGISRGTFHNSFANNWHIDDRDYLLSVRCLQDYR
jgi:uncharacterized protein (TIGR02145 family)